MFDTFACKLFRLLEHIGKIFSTFILVAFSIDRYCAVCHPLQVLVLDIRTFNLTEFIQVRVRNQRTVFIFLGIMFLVTCGMLSPILLYAHSKVRWRNMKETHIRDVSSQFIIHTCSSHLIKRKKSLCHMYLIIGTCHAWKVWLGPRGDHTYAPLQMCWWSWPWAVRRFHIVLFCFGETEAKRAKNRGLVQAYLMPLLFMIYFYYEMLIRLFKQAKAIKQTLTGRRSHDDKKLTIPVGHIAIYTLAICSFHFICWLDYKKTKLISLLIPDLFRTPYWISILYSLYEELYQDEKSTGSPPTYAFIYFMYGVHALPYINSASNFILYGLLNRQVTRECKGTGNK